MGCLSKAFGSKASLVASDALATPVPTACGVKRSNYSRFHPFFQQQKKVGERGTTAQQFKNAALMRRGVLCTVQIAFVTARHALACKVGCKMDVCCETALRAVRDGFIGGSFGIAFCDGLFDVLRNGICREHIASYQDNSNSIWYGIWSVYPKINRVSLYCGIRFFCFFIFGRLYIASRQDLHLLVRWPPVSQTQRR